MRTTVAIDDDVLEKARKLSVPFIALPKWWSTRLSERELMMSPIHVLQGSIARNPEILV